jgi:hypothetical protein
MQGEATTRRLVEPFANDDLQDNLNPVGHVYYSFSTLLCTPWAESTDSMERYSLDSFPKCSDLRRQTRATAWSQGGRNLPSAVPNSRSRCNSEKQPCFSLVSELYWVPTENNSCGHRSINADFSRAGSRGNATDLGSRGRRWRKNIPIEKLVAKFPFWVIPGAQLDKIRQLFVSRMNRGRTDCEQFPPMRA